MYAFLRGRLVSAVPPHVVLDVQGVGYQLLTPINLFADLPKVGEMVLLHTAYVLRENLAQLFGFSTASDRALFELLTTVSGVGPKMALALIGHLSADRLRTAIGQGDWSLLTQAPGVGRKTADRLIIEMRGRLDVIATATALPNVGDAVNALVHLGYAQKVARQAVDKALNQLPDSPEIGILVTAALREATSS